MKTIIPRTGFLSAVLTVLLVPATALAQSVNFDLGEGPTTTARLVQLTLLMTVLTLAPSILMMVTCFTRIVVVLSFVRSAIGIQQTPPNVVLISLALFLTLFVMQPVFEKAWDDGVKPLASGEIDEETAFTRMVEPFHAFMMKHTRPKDLALFMDMAKIDAKDKDGKALQDKDVPLRALTPAFMISELRRAFEIGFLVFLPFLIIDMVVASILMSMGMMMLPPSVISLPFKIIFFVLVDGWYLIAGSLVQSYGG
jgi:flagellar biosynthetic protein FliP